MSDREGTKNTPGPAYMQNREISWLEFNKRVLDQGADPAVPLFDRLSFVSIFWSNLQEFFMIRVGSLTDLSLVKKTIIDSKSGLTPAEQLSAIYDRCHELYPYYEQCYKGLRKEFAKKGILNTRGKGLTSVQMAYVEDYFDANIMPFLSPQIVNSRHPFPHLENGALYVIVRLDDEAAKAAKAARKKQKSEAAEKGTPSISGKPDRGPAGKGEKSDKSDRAVTSKGDKPEKGAKAHNNMGAEGVTLGIIPMPRQCKRVIRIPGEGFQFMLLEHVIEMFVDKIYSMYKVKHTNVICVTRNADLDATEGAEEHGDDYREHIKRILKKRTRLAPVRLESERELSATVKPVLMERLNLKEHQSFVTSVPLDMSYTWSLPSMVDAATRASLSLEPFTPQWPASLDRTRPILEQVCEREVLLSYPYETMDAFVQLLREAAVDPSVSSIKITLYRLASQSHLAEALISAAEHGKEVTAVFELRARFDEANNIEWSQRFEEAGCNVLYGFRDYKVHSKVCCITRQTPDGVQHITQLGTGNYNEKTAKLYTDFSFITTDPAIGADVATFFRNMTLENLSDEYRTLWVAPLQIKQNIMAGIDEQIELARAGRPSGLFFKTNSITDKQVIDKIVEASQAGVQCTMLVRGISCIVPGIDGYTDNVAVVSIVGRLLEHSRIYAFGPFDGDCRIYLSSADLMTRNMDKRVEIAWPVLNPAIKAEIIGYVGTCMADTAKLRDLLPSKQYTDLGFFARTNKESGQVELFDSQDFLIHEAERKQLEASERLLATQIGSVDKIRRTAEIEQDLERLGEEVSEFEQTLQDAQQEPSVQDINLEQLLAGVASHAALRRDEEARAFEHAEAEASVATAAAAAFAGTPAQGYGYMPNGVAVTESAQYYDYGAPGVAGDVLEYQLYEEAPPAQEAGMHAEEVEIGTEAPEIATTASGLPNIDGLYEPEPNPEGKFSVPSMTGGMVEVERVGGPVVVEEEAAEQPQPEAYAEQPQYTQYNEQMYYNKQYVQSQQNAQPAQPQPDQQPYYGQQPQYGQYQAQQMPQPDMGQPAPQPEMPQSGMEQPMQQPVMQGAWPQQEAPQADAQPAPQQGAQPEQPAQPAQPQQPEPPRQQPVKNPFLKRFFR